MNPLRAGALLGALALALVLATAGCGTQPPGALSSQPQAERLAALCGNGLIEGTEACDDGNTNSGDGCSGACVIEPGYSCTGQRSVCNPGCGDGLLGDGEQCDDGNAANNDGCASTCVIEKGFSCTGIPSSCAVRCGDGVKAPQEGCDDGNTTAGDGCSPTCAIESGYACFDPNVHALFLRRGFADCVHDANVSAPTLSPSAIVPEVTVPGRYRMQYVAGAASYSDVGNSWYPGIFGVNFDAGAGVQTFSLGGTGFSARTQAMLAGFSQKRDFTVAAGDVRLALVDGNCGDNTNGAVFYRIDSESSCIVVPVIITLSGPTTSTVFTGTGEPGSGIEVHVDGGVTPVCTATVDASGHWTCNAPGLVDGSHTGVATEIVPGTRVDSAPVTFILDRTGPTPPTITTPPSGSTVNTAKPPLAGGAEPASTVTVREGSTVLCTATATAQGTWTCVPVQPLADGVHTVTATAADSLGNGSLTSAPDTFTVDTTAPQKPVITTPTQGQLLSDNTPTVGGTAEPGSTVRVYIDGGQAPACTSVTSAGGQWSCDVSPALADGSHTATATATDAVGNTSQRSNSVTFLIDATPPDTFIDSGPDSRTTSRTAGFTYSSNEANVHYECSLDGAAFTPCAAQYTVALGPHTLGARAIDAAGNVDPTPAQYSWTVNSRSLGGGGCSAAPGSAWLALTALLALRRRRR